MTEKIQAFWSWYQDSGLSSVPVQVPLVEMVLMCGVLTVCLLFRFPRVGLIATYIFVYRWAWSVRDMLYLEGPRHHAMFTTGYIIFGILVLVLSVIGMIRSED